MSLFDDLFNQLLAAHLEHVSIHQHKCTKCQTVWEHRLIDIPDTNPAYDSAHQCPNCGTEQRYIYAYDSDEHFIPGAVTHNGKAPEMTDHDDTASRRDLVSVAMNKTITKIYRSNEDGVRFLWFYFEDGTGFQAPFDVFFDLDGYTFDARSVPDKKPEGE